MKGEDNAVADALSRLFDSSENKDSQEKETEEEKQRREKQAKAIKEGKEKRHLMERYGKKFWRFDNGDIREVPDEGIREEMNKYFHLVNQVIFDQMAH
jgi:hypothetical protein